MSQGKGPRKLSHCNSCWCITIPHRTSLHHATEIPWLFQSTFECPSQSTNSSSPGRGVRPPTASELIHSGKRSLVGEVDIHENTALRTGIFGSFVICLHQLIQCRLTTQIQVDCAMPLFSFMIRRPQFSNPAVIAALATALADASGPSKPT